MDAHNGLRGVAALWVVVYHCLLYSLVNVNLLGSTLMPLFFSLSGFSLAVVYGRSALPPPSSCCGPRAIEEGHGATGGQASGNKPFSFWDFQQNRFARVMPGERLRPHAEELGWDARQHLGPSHHEGRWAASTASCIDGVPVLS